MREINIAILGKWAFHASDFVVNNQLVPGCNMVSAWDEDSVAGRAWAEELNMTFYEDYRTILADPHINGVIVSCATVDHAQLCIDAANAGKAVMVEKAPMLTRESAQAVKAAVEKNGVLFSVSDPLVKPEILQLKKMMDEGFFGEITMLNVRYAHAKGLEGSLPDRLYDRAEAGGGVSVDIGCHGVHLLHWFLGIPVKCASVYGSFTEKARVNCVDDNAAVSYQYENGAIGVVQSSWAAPGEQGIIDLYGTKGCAHAFGGQIHYCMENKQWHVIDREEMPPQETKPMEQWLDIQINGADYPRYHVETATAMAEMLEAAQLAADMGYVL